ncbi:MAG: VOC family protein [Fimbriimonadaceae bacterium]|nr:VOC family protein [Fimbriimonadaceae bacterium]
MANAFGTDRVTQIGIVVRNIERTRAEWSKLLGVEEPPIIVTAGFDQAQTFYRGAPSEATAKLCFFNMGQVAIELIEPDGKPSAWQDHLDRHGEGVQHIAVVVPSMTRALSALHDEGISLAMKGEYTGGRYAYVASSEKLGVILELLENDD